MARGNRRRRELIRSLGLQGQAEDFSTETLRIVKEKNDAAAAKAAKRRARKESVETVGVDIVSP